MKAEDIKQVVLQNTEKGSTKLLEGEIEGAAVRHHMLDQDEALTLPADPGLLRILFLIRGEARFSDGGAEAAHFNERAVFVAAPEKTVTIRTAEGCRLLEIQWKLTETDIKALAEAAEALPVARRYLDAEQYRDPFKSMKTISRALIPHRVLPRFAMGSVETHGTDLIGQHEHPLLDQFFFSFPENDCVLLIDDLRYPMKGDTLLHIPLGSNHGVEVGETQCAHYLWIDFIPTAEGLAYLDEVHKATGEKKRF